MSTPLFRRVCTIVTVVLVGLTLGPGTRPSLAAATTDIGPQASIVLLPDPSCNSSALAVSLHGSIQTMLGASGRQTAVVCGGNPPYRYNWSFNGSSGTPSLDANFSYRATMDGVYVVNLTVKDSGALHASVGEPVEFYGPDPMRAQISVADSGSSVFFIARALGGTAPYSYFWSGPGAPAGWSASPNWTTSSLPTGRSHVSVTIRDVYNYSARFALDVVNSAAPALPWYASLAWPIVGIAAGFAVALISVFLLRRRRPSQP